MVFGKAFKCTATRKCYKVEGTLSYNGVNVVYVITCQCCKLQYVRSAITFKQRFRIHIKKDVVQLNTFLKYSTSEDKFDDNPRIQLIESVKAPSDLSELKS